MQRQARATPEAPAACLSASRSRARASSAACKCGTDPPRSLHALSSIFRNLIPPLMGQIDFTPILGFLVLQFVAQVLSGGPQTMDIM